MARIFPSLIAADLLNLEDEIKKLEPHCDGFHLDVMDNHFVPNLTFGPAFINAIGSITHKPLWAHLMVSNPNSIIERLTIAPKSIISVHYESDDDIAQLITLIKSKSWIPSIAIKPATPITDLVPLLQHVSHILVMLVEPGFSGQPLLSETIEKVIALHTYIHTQQLNITISVDGGITQKNIAHLHTCGAQDIAAATAVFENNNVINNLQHLKKLL